MINWNQMNEKWDSLSFGGEMIESKKQSTPKLERGESTSVHVRKSHKVFTSLHFLFLRCSCWSAVTYIFHHLGLFINSFKRNISCTNLLSDTTSFTVLHVSVAELKTEKDQKYLHVKD